MTEGTLSTPAIPTTTRLARWSVLIIFFISGVVFASWVTHIPYVKARFNLSEGVLGLSLLAIACGSIVSLTLTGAVVARVGSRLVNIVAVLAFCLTLPLLLLAPSFPLLVVLLAFFGLCIGAMEIAANVQAVAIEERYGRPIMSTFHGLFSAGGLIGAALAGLLLAWGVTPVVHVLGVTVVMTILALLTLRWLLPSGFEQTHDAPMVALPGGPLLGMGVLAFFCLVGEGAIADWSAVYLRDTLDQPADRAALGYAVFSLTMAIGRFTGDALQARLNAVQLLRISGILSAVGLGATLVIGHPLVALIGFGCVGLGLSNIAPLLFSAAGRTPGIASGTGIAAVATAGYFGFLAGPPLIGFVAQVSNLSIALGIVVVFMALIAVLARRAMRVGG